ncbi:hypothetical protein M513_13689, partial [Trichuris suis]
MKRTIMEIFGRVGTLNGSNSGANEKTDENGNENRIVIALPPECKEQLSASSRCHFRAIYKRMTLMMLDDTQVHMCTKSPTLRIGIVNVYCELVSVKLHGKNLEPRDRNLRNQLAAVMLVPT